MNLLTRAECNLLRGLAILGIFLHNFCHWLPSVVRENEYQWKVANVAWMDKLLETSDLTMLPIHLVSYLGHYGVPIFLFLSAYGLERKYNSGPRMPQGINIGGGVMEQMAKATAMKRWLNDCWRFLRYHYLKLLKMLIVGFAIFTFVDAITPGRWHYSVTQIVTILTMTANFLPQPDENIWPGPYWYFGLMLQCYAVYRLLLFRRHWGWTVGLMVVCIVGQLLLAPESEALNRYRYNFMGGMLPFGLGMLYARYGERIILTRLSPLATVVSWVFTSMLIWSASHTYWGWTLAPAIVCVSAVYFAKLFTAIRLPWLMSPVYRALSWLGTVSAAMFVIHPVMRKVFIPISRGGDVWTGLLLYIIGAVAAAWAVNELMKKLPNPKM